MPVNIEDEHIADRDAFVFCSYSLETYKPFISSAQQDDISISSALSYCVRTYGNFGTWWIFYIIVEYDRFEQQENDETIIYQLSEHGHEYLSGSEKYLRNIPTLSPYHSVKQTHEAKSLKTDLNP